MAYSGKTANYNLPQIEGTDKVNWFDLNGAFATIDTGMESNKQEAKTANQKADNNTNAIAALTETVNNQGQTGLDNTSEIDKLKQTTSLHTTHLNEIDVVNQNQNTRLQALESGDSETGTELAQIKTDLNTVSNVAETNSQNIASAETEIQTLQVQVEALQDDVGSITVTKQTVPINRIERYGNGAPLPSMESGNVTINSSKIIHKIAITAVLNGSVNFTAGSGVIISFDSDLIANEVDGMASGTGIIVPQQGSSDNLFNMLIITNVNKSPNGMISLYAKSTGEFTVLNPVIKLTALF